MSRIRFRLTPLRAALLTALYVVLWGGVVFAVEQGWVRDSSGTDVRQTSAGGRIDLAGWVGLYALGFLWTVYLLEWATRRVEARRVPVDVLSRPQIPVGGEAPGVRRRGWNPLDPAARYYGFWPAFACFVALAGAAAPFLAQAMLDQKEGWKHVPAWAKGATILAVVALATAAAQSPRLRQTLTTLTAYSLVFLLAYILAHLTDASAGEEIEADLPAGGGNDSIKATQVKVKQVPRKRFIFDPHALTKFSAPRPIDQIDVNLKAETANQYKAGSGPGGLGKGAGKGGGFGSGTGAGKYQLVRLRHADKNWNKNFGVNGDRNLLAELKAREPLTQVGDEDVQIDAAGLARVSAKKPYPILYVGGTHGFAPSAADKRLLREYLVDKHGMILGDCLGPGFHNPFVAAMTEITGVPPVVVPRDDRIHQRPYDLPQLPIVVAHGGSAPLGWRIDGRWAVYYHPGALSDAWRDDHAGIKRVIWEQCYQLGINILYYAYVEQDKWRQAQQASP